MPAAASHHHHDAEATPAASALLAGAWQVRVLGGLEARNGDVVLRHFVSHAIGALLARLALFPQRLHAREELVELLWPGVDLDAGRNRLRHALSTLKRLLEPPGMPPGSVLVANRHAIQLVPGAMQCDALEFERCLRERRMGEARDWYRGELLPGFYEDWIQDERRRLTTLLEKIGAPATAGAERATAQPQARIAPALPADRPLLPGYLTSYIGRSAERATLLAWLSEHRLVTLSGAGGCGKTRLAVETARRVASAEHGFDLIRFVALADCSTGAEAAAQLRTALHLSAAAGDPIDQAVAMLSTRRPLLVLDNFEQIVASGGAELVATLLERVPALHVLVTSRRVLGVPGEREFALVPLPQPDPHAPLAEVAASPSVALFIDRARQVRPDFQVTERNCDALVALCGALEGLPLAIELAASRSRAFSPRDMHAALSERFSLLARQGTHPAKPALRHDSLRGAIDWSWQLLSAQQQRFLLALSVFRGGWTAASAQVVCDEPDAHALLESLAADSLLRSDVDASGAMRFSMLDMIRAFLRERIDPKAAALLRRQHRAHCLATALGLQARGGLAIDAAELPNIHEALRSAVDDGEAELALMLGLALRHHWERNGMAPEALAWLARALNASGPRSAPGHGPWVHACILVALLTLAAGEGAAAQTLAERALAEAGDAPAPRAAALCALVRIEIERHLFAADLMPQLREAMALAEQVGATDVVAESLSLMGMLNLFEHKDAATADAFFARAHACYLDIGLTREASLLLYERTICLQEMGRVADALVQARAFERECAAHGDRYRQLKAINLQGVFQAQLRYWADAVQSYRRCAELAWQTHNHYWLGFALWNHGRNLARLRQPERAGLLMAFSEHYWRSRVGQLDDRDRRFVRQVRALVCHQVGEARTSKLWADGVRLTLAQAVQMVLAEPSTTTEVRTAQGAT